jgi:hypothetical protein
MYCMQTGKGTSKVTKKASAQANSSATRTGTKMGIVLENTGNYQSYAISYVAQ